MARQTTDTPVLDVLANMTADSIAASTLDSQTLVLVPEQVKWAAYEES